MKTLPGPIDAGAASRNRRARRSTILLTLAALPAACGTPETPANGGTSPPANGAVAEPPANGGVTLVSGADDGVWESLPVGARVRIGGYLGGAFEDGARVNVNPHVCAHLAMTRAEWGRLNQTVRPGQPVTVYGSKAPRLNGGCLIQLERVGIVAR